MSLEDIYEVVRNTFAVSNGDDQVFLLNEKQIVIKPENLMEAVEMILAAGVFHLSTITGLYADDKLTLLYHFWQKEGLTLRTMLHRDNERIDSLTSMIPGAAFYEREIAEMFGIVFNGLIAPERMFLPDNWEEEPPMRISERVEEKSAQQQKKRASDG